MTVELSPDMIWNKCRACGRNFTLADMTDDGCCPWCGSVPE